MKTYILKWKNNLPNMHKTHSTRSGHSQKYPWLSLYNYMHIIYMHACLNAHTHICNMYACPYNIIYIFKYMLFFLLIDFPIKEHVILYF